MRTKLACGLLAAACLAATAAISAPGDLDPAFGTGGLALFERGQAYREGTSIAVQPDGKYLVTGVAWGWETFGSPLLRFNADHTLDTTFGANGAAGYWGIRTAVKVVDGKVLTTENIYRWVTDPATMQLYRDVVVARRNADGTTDNTFGSGGRTPTFNAGTGGEQRLTALEVAPGGKLVAAGWTNGTGGNTRLLLVRYNADGSLDTGFGTGGWKNFDVAGSSATIMEIRGLAIDPNNGNMLVVGFLGAPNAHAPFYILMDSAGASLSQNILPGNGSSECNAAAWYSATRWLIACSAVTDTGSYAFLSAVTNTGTWDMSLLRFSDLGGSDDAWRGITVASDGWIYTTGQGGGRLVVGAFRPDGQPDTLFGSSGLYVMPEAEYSSGAAIALTNHSFIVTGTSGGPDSLIPVVVLNGIGQRTNVSYQRKTASTNYSQGKVLPDGKILLGGNTGINGDPHFLATRVNPNGTLDTTFGIGGHSIVKIPNMDFSVGSRDMKLQPDGKVLLTGEWGGWTVNQRRLGVARLTPGGTGDPAFNAAGTPGYNFVNSGVGYAYTRHLSLQADGKIVASGQGVDAGGIVQIAAARFNADGTLDTGYGTSGIAMSAFPTNTGTAGGELTADGKLVAAGGGGGGWRVVRFTAAGAIDTGWGTNGTVTFPAPAGFTNFGVSKVRVLPDQKILLLGQTNSPTGFGAVLVRLNADGSPDASFGGGTGWGYIEGITGTNATGAVFRGDLMPNGKFVAAGRTTATDVEQRGTVVRFTANGVPDTSFGTNGVRFYDEGAFQYSDLHDVVSAPDGSLYIVSDNQLGTERFGALRKTVAERMTLARTDLNADGRSDLLWRNASSGLLYRMFMNGATITGQGVAYSEPNTAWTVVGDADFNGDGTSDLVWRNSATGQVYVMTMAANGSPLGGAVVHTEPNQAWKIVHTLDFDGDGKADLLWWNSNTGQVYAMRMDGTTIASQGMVYAEPNTDWRIAVVGDFSGSGKSNQLMWRNSVTGQLYLMTIQASGGGFTQTGAMVYQEPNTTWKVIGAADFDGDGKSDLLWRNGSTGQVYVMLMNGSAIGSQGMAYQEPDLAWKIVAQGDYNGDGKADLMWRRDGTGELYFMPMNGLAPGAGGAMVYQEPDGNWRILGTQEYGQATGVFGP